MANTRQKIVIAHRGASGYLPEHTLASKAMAHAMGADYLEQDLVMTCDDRLIVMHDRYLDTTTDVAQRFPSRAREDGRFYAIDFTLEEIKQLRVSERFKLVDGVAEAVYPDRFPVGPTDFRVASFEEEIEFIQDLNDKAGKSVGIYPEIKCPWFHRKEGKDISSEVLRVLKEFGYRSKEDSVYLQCFDSEELKRVRANLMPELGLDLRLVQLIAENDWQEVRSLKGGEWVAVDFEWMKSKEGLSRIAEYADGIGPWHAMVVDRNSSKESLQISPLVSDAQGFGLVAHPYTFRLEEGEAPVYANDFEDWLRIFFEEVGVDGVFSDFPDRVVEFFSNAQD